MYIERQGARLFSTTLGRGPNVILLHPTPAHHAFWLPVAHALADRYRFTLVDLRGHGQSTLGSGAITMEKLAEDVHAVLLANGIAHAALVGCSIGGYTLYEYWRRFPKEVTALAIVCGKPQPDTPGNREKRHDWMASAAQPGGLSDFFDLMADTLVGPTARRLHPEVRDAARAMMSSVSLDVMHAVQQGLMQRPDSVPMLKTIRVPVCAVAGGEDQSSTPAEMQEIVDQVPNAEFHLLKDAGHYAPLEQPETISDILQDFLDRQTLQTSPKTGAPFVP